MRLARKPSKYRNVKTEVDGFTFDSKAEASRYCDLKLLQRAGEIHGLECQVPFPIKVGEAGEVVTVYVADFTYHTPESAFVVEDVKGVVTPEFRLKRKLLRATTGQEITIISASKSKTRRRIPSGSEGGATPAEPNPTKTGERK